MTTRIGTDESARVNTADPERDLRACDDMTSARLAHNVPQTRGDGAEQHSQGREGCTGET